jgi:signal peptidase
MKKILNVITYVLCGLFAIILLFNTVLIVQSVIDENKVPDVFGYFPLVVLSDSMNPTLQSGDLAVYQKKTADNVSEGDVVAFYDPDGSGETIVTHRIVQKEDGESGFRTKGDANNTEDTSLVPDENVVGVFKFRIPKLGNAVLFLQTTKGMLVCIVIPLFLIMMLNGIGKDKAEQKIEQKVATEPDLVEGVSNEK